ncbi:hypothetical protein [Mesorhizobium sp. DCY119]|uniref:hypothetical protein n=1 Tax=Mesorhizobium sp. DCY119 TaxID=2108445 RepID=UPI000E76493A|nr:hypothetical protein [Mesorhizobium sp. DCY119]RJG40941.1 hypothetical protein D3Y55_27370 [Mesorhizobium sp. DCY119]
MKLPHRDFVVEIKSSRRLTKTKSNSIWGSIDMKAHAAEAEDELRALENSSAIQNPVQVPTAPDNSNVDRLLVADAGGQEDSGASRDALDPIPVNNQDQTKVDVVPKVRTGTKSGSRTATGRRGAGTALPIVQLKEASMMSDSISSGDLKKEERGKRGQRQSSGTTPPGTKTRYDLDKDLVELETENQRLKKLLADKLNSENAELRRKLKGL